MQGAATKFACDCLFGAECECVGWLRCLYCHARGNACPHRPRCASVDAAGDTLAVCSACSRIDNYRREQQRLVAARGDDEQ